jgi:hypothetical protein
VAACNGFCVTEYVIYDPLRRLHKHYGWNCVANPPVQDYLWYPNPITPDPNGTCSSCNACVQAHREAQLGAEYGNGYLDWGAYRKGVPNSRNPWHQLDEPVPGPYGAVIAEYTAEYRVDRYFLVRLFVVANESGSRRIHRLGWELDPLSPPSPFFVPHFSSAWISSVTYEPGGHLVRIRRLGKFHVATVDPRRVARLAPHPANQATPPETTAPPDAGSPVSGEDEEPKAHRE